MPRKHRALREYLRARIIARDLKHGEYQLIAQAWDVPYSTVPYLIRDECAQMGVPLPVLR